MTIVTYLGQEWELDPRPTPTSDGHLLTTGYLLDEDGTRVSDPDGFPVAHSFYLGRMDPARVHHYPKEN